MTADNKKIIVRELVLAALLHDIGKTFIDDNRNLHVYDEKNDKEKVEKIKKILNELGINNVDLIYYSVLYHHDEEKAKHSPPLRIIRKADELSSEIRIEYEENEEEKRREKNWKIKLVYPFSLFKLNSKKLAYLNNLYGLIDLKEKMKKNPLVEEEDELPTLSDYREEWKSKYQEKFKEELKKALKIRDPDLVLAIFYKYLYFYPETSKNNAINLFSFAFHSKIVAMLTDLLYKIKEENKKIYIVRVEVVGTHQFILSNLKRKREYEEEMNYLKRINASSIFIDTLTAIVTKIILKLANSYNTNILFLSGSESKIVVGLDENTKKKIEEIIEKINEKLFELTLGNLYLILDFEEVPSDEEKIIENLVNVAFNNEEEIKKIEEVKILTKIKLLKKSKLDKWDDEKKREYSDFLNGLISLFSDKNVSLILGEDLNDIIFRHFNQDVKNIISDLSIIPFELILNNYNLEEIIKVIEEKDKIFIYLRSGRVTGKSFEDFENVKRTNNVCAIKIDGDKVGDLFSKLLKEYLQKDIKNYKNIDENFVEMIKKYGPLILLRVSDLLSFMFKYLTLRLAENFTDESERFVSVIYNSGDELSAVGDLESIINFYREFLELKEKFLLNILKTSSAIIYTHYKHPFYFVYRSLSENVEIAKKNKPIQNLEEYKRKEDLESYFQLKDSLYFAGAEIVLEGFEKDNFFERIKELKEIANERNGLGRSRIANMIELINRSIDEIKKKKVRSLIFLIYYIARSKVKKNNIEEVPKVLRDFLEDIKNNFLITNYEEKMKKIENVLKYWMAILGYVYTITRNLEKR